MVFYPDTKTLISNMLGTAINENVLVIHTMKEKYEFRLPTGKNGSLRQNILLVKDMFTC